MSRVLLLLALCIAGCTDESATVRVLQNEGYTQIQTEGYDMFACSEDDNFATKFTATNARGLRVHGTVCCGLLKSCTVRW